MKRTAEIVGLPPSKRGRSTSMPLRQGFVQTTGQGMSVDGYDVPKYIQSVYMGPGIRNKTQQYVMNPGTKDYMDLVESEAFRKFPMKRKLWVFGASPTEYKRKTATPAKRVRKKRKTSGKGKKTKKKSIRKKKRSKKT